MFNPIRNAKREITKAEAEEILTKGEYGVLSTFGSGGYPYGVPVSYVYFGGSVYFHCAPEGHKLDNIAFNSKVSFCVVGSTKVIPEKFTTKYESVILFGTAKEVTGEEKYSAFVEITKKYSPEYLTEGIEYIEKTGQKAKIIKISAEHISGKASR